jgi:hypothetical protein
MVRYLDCPQEENFIKAYYQLSPFTITPTNIFANYSQERAAWLLRLLGALVPDEESFSYTKSRERWVVS